MALTRTVHGTWTSDPFNSAAFVASSFTPTNASLLVALIYCLENGGSTNPAGDITLSATLADGTTDAGLTFTRQRYKGDTNSWTHGAAIFTAPYTLTSTAIRLKMQAGSRSIASWRSAALDYTGYNTGAPVGGGIAGVLANNGATSVTLDATPASTSEVVALLCAKQPFGGSGTPSVGSSFTQRHLINGGDGGLLLHSQTRGGSTSTTVDWADATSGSDYFSDTLGLAIEVKEAATGRSLSFNRGATFGKGSAFSGAFAC